MLCVSQRVHIPAELYFYRPLSEAFEDLKTRSWTDFVQAMLAIVDSTCKHAQLPLEHISKVALTIPPEQQSLAALVNCIYTVDAKRIGKSKVQWGDKTPLNIRNARRILTIFPAARFVHMIRDGLDVVASLLNMGSNYTVETASQRWAGAIVSGKRLRKNHPESVYELRYESLVANPRQELKGLCQFLGIRFKRKMLSELSVCKEMRDVPTMGHLARVMEPLTTSRIGAGRRTLNTEERQQVLRLIGRFLEQQNYSHTED